MLADVTGDKHRTVPPWTKGNTSEMIAWADMLSMIGQKNSRLHALLVRDTKSPEPYPKTQDVSSFMSWSGKDPVLRVNCTPVRASPSPVLS